MNHELGAALRAHASGLYYLEAASELITSHRAWLRRSDFTGFIITGPSIDWQAAISALDAGELPSAPAANSGYSAWQPAWPTAFQSAFATPSPDWTIAISSW